MHLSSAVYPQFNIKQTNLPHKGFTLVMLYEKNTDLTPSVVLDSAGHSLLLILYKKLTNHWLGSDRDVDD